MTATLPFNCLLSARCNTPQGTINIFYFSNLKFIVLLQALGRLSVPGNVPRTSSY